MEYYHGQDPDGFINGEPRSYDLDVLVRNVKITASEIKANASGADVTEFARCVKLYERQTGNSVASQIIVAVTIQRAALERAKEHGVIVATSFSELE